MGLIKHTKLQLSMTDTRAIRHMDAFQVASQSPAVPLAKFTLVNVSIDNSHRARVAHVTPSVEPGTLLRPHTPNK